MLHKRGPEPHLLLSCLGQYLFDLLIASSSNPSYNLRGTATNLNLPMRNSSPGQKGFHIGVLGFGKAYHIIQNEPLASSSFKIALNIS